MTDKPVECSVPTHDWEKISKHTIITGIVGDFNIPGDISMSIFRCKRCKVLRFFSNK